MHAGCLLRTLAALSLPVLESETGALATGTDSKTAGTGLNHTVAPLSSYPLLPFDHSGLCPKACISIASGRPSHLHHTARPSAHGLLLQPLQRRLRGLISLGTLVGGGVTGERRL